MTNKTRTAQAGIAFVTWQLTRRDWEVMPAPDTSKRSILLLIRKESLAKEVLIQPRSFINHDAVRLGQDIIGPDSFLFDWMVITTHVRSDSPTCFMLDRQDALEIMKQDPGGPFFWIDPSRYRLSCFQNRWDDIGRE
ncbi:MAG: hypothetical protein ABF968_05250 [Acetobacter sp.]|uniref:hypothetical protein n=1 Tax=Acetobacter sp. TaxID=440 RepID=UPI0039EC6CBB